MGGKMKQWYFGDFGGRFVPETLMKALKELEQAYQVHLIAVDRALHLPIKHQNVQQ